MSETLTGRVRDAQARQDTEACVVGRAEAVYHDCLARFGHDSAEAYVAQVFWRRERVLQRGD